MRRLRGYLLGFGVLLGSAFTGSAEPPLAPGAAVPPEVNATTQAVKTMLEGFIGDAEYMRPEPVGAIRVERVLIIVAPGFRDMEFFYALYRFHEAGYRITVIAPTRGEELTGLNGYKYRVDYTIENVEPDWFTFVYIPGGADIAALTGDPRVVDLVKAVHKNQKYMAAVSEGVRVFLKAGILLGKNVAAPPQMAVEVQQAAATYRDNYMFVSDPRTVTGRQSGSVPLVVSEMFRIAEKFGPKR